MKKNIYLEGIDKDFLEGNIKWAKTLMWTKSDGQGIDDHTHCIICMRPMKKNDGVQKFNSGNHFIDEYCYQLFIDFTSQ